MVVFFIFITVICLKPNMFGHPDNYIPASPSTTPAHIVPEWYFRPFYAIRKSVPSKLGGAAAIAGAIILLYLIPIMDVSETSFTEVRGW
jgi:quinol-cytochrome oxidoreductase complex cytochrome b subunit